MAHSHPRNAQLRGGRHAGQHHLGSKRGASRGAEHLALHPVHRPEGGDLGISLGENKNPRRRWVCFWWLLFSLVSLVFLSVLGFLKGC